MPREKKNELTRAQKRFLRKLFPKDSSLFEAEETWIYGTDASRIFVPPLAVVRPESVEQVKELLSWAHREKLPLIPRARATNVVGACIPGNKGIVVSTLKLNRVLEIDADDFTAVAEPGVVTADFQNQVKAQGLYYPPDPASVNISTLGGNVSTNAGGLRAIKYGVTRDYVLGIEAVLPGGEIVNTGKKVFKDVVGLDLTSLLVGSEGTLAFYTKILFKLLSLPQASATALLGFPDLDTVMQSAKELFQSDLTPVAMEFLDQNTISCLRKAGKLPVPPDSNCLLLLQFEGLREHVQGDLHRLSYLSRTWGNKYMDIADSKEKEQELWEVRKQINPASFQMGPNKMSVDVSLPRGKLQAAVREIGQIGENFGLYVLIFGHLGDGNLHVNVMYDSGKNSESLFAGKLIERVLYKVLELGGSISGEHGVGLVKKPYLNQQLSRKQRNLMQGIKRVFDPENIMNPYKAY